MSYVHKDKTLLRYEREHDLVRLTLRGMSNHELLEVLIGLWGRLKAEDREWMIDAMQVYHTDTTSWLSTLAAALMKDTGDNEIVDLAALSARGEKVRPV